MEKTDLPKHTLSTLPTIAPSVFIANGAQVMGDVRIEEYASVWYNSVLRGDVNYISVGKNTNIQDGSVVHVTNDTPCIIGANVTIGHNANIHGCTIEDGCLIGIGAIILTGAHIKKGSIVGAGSVVLENTTVEENSLVVGIPGKKVRELNTSIFEEHLKWAAKYVELAKIHKEKFPTTFEK
ncbi:gamma carbonic anhydrase family protein [Candidatus Uabimicrobium sp. HlEnr_7]|uniref:gamma carbonic anhydrase family protein n=1 Tax=Candidatus Uabimicrobium helgolandensis TaxID=3095367 RepID=UPI0035576E37